MKRKNEGYHSFRELGVRLTEEEVAGLSEHDSQKELPLLYAYHMFDKAHLVMLAEENIIPREDAVKMLKALREMEAERALRKRFPLPKTTTVPFSQLKSLAFKLIASDILIPEYHKRVIRALSLSQSQ